MTAQELRASLLQEAVTGRLVPQRAEEGSAEALYEEIRQEKARLAAEKKIKKSKKLPPIMSDEIPADFPSNWKICYLDDIAFVTKLAGFEYTKNIAPNLSSTGIPLFKGKNIQNGHLILTFESYIPETVSDNLPRSQINKKCLLTPYVGTIGNIAIFDGQFKAHLGSNVGKIELFNSEHKQFILEEYLLYYLRSNIGYAELTKHKKATAQESISIDAIRNVIIALPPLAEQKRIVDKLEELLPLVDAYGEAEQRLAAYEDRFPDALKRSLLREAVTGRLVPQRAEEGSAETLYEEIRQEKARLVAEKKIQKEKPLPPVTEEEQPFSIPSTWKWVRLPEIAQILLGKTLNKAKDSGTLHPYLCSINVTWQGIKLDTVKEVLFTKVELEKYQLRPGDLLICEGGDIGRTAVWEKDIPMYYQNALHRVRFFAGLSPYFFRAIMEYYKKIGLLDKFCKGVTIKHLAQSSLCSLVFPLPPLAEQKRIVNKLEELLALAERIREARR